jgi:uncharacterized protein YdhG (YjbR/CyaY superfamily)
MISKAANVDAFLAGLPAEERAVFARLRAEFRQAGVTESMRYGMPGYVIGAVMVGGFNRQKHYLCLYANPDALVPHRAALGRLDCGKGCVRFRHPADLPLAVAEKIIRAAVKLAWVEAM